MSQRPLLNTNQHRHLETVFRLLREDLHELSALAATQDPVRQDRIRERIGRLDASIGRLAETFELTLTQPPEPLRRIQAVASAWASDLGGMFAAKLAGYGRVDPRLLTVLDPQVNELREALFALVDAAREAAGNSDTMH